MPSSASPPPGGQGGQDPGGGRSSRPGRADARRNREKLLAVARDAFAAATDTPVSLEAVAREAGVGIGTLYRHFPTRDALVEAVYSAELADLTDSAAALAAELPPEEALRAWMDRYGAFFARKHGILDILRAGRASGSIAMPATRARVTAAIATFLTEGARTGALRADVPAEDVTLMLLGVFLSTSAHDSPEQVDRLLDLLIDSLRPGAAPQDAEPPPTAAPRD
ncbi:TetR/AcrR family transcriptional regulator [Streptomyces sp. NPDC050560]|uniref:TetR/AcrR family transcriptional regulator n=1 Tax=Streptomyces sp. NPDC050560 TaxID=3365630 RepID=UPI0037A58A4F